MTHPEQTLRDKVWSVLDSVWVGDSEDDLYIKADAVISLVREALLSDEAMKESAVALFLRDNPLAGRDDMDTEDDEWAYYSTAAREGVTAALDAVTGEGDR